jgi:acetyl esterase/lipase
MKRKIATLIICSLTAAGSFAQKTLNIHRNDLSSESYLTSSIDSVKFSNDGRVLYVYTAEQLADIPVASVDSITITTNSGNYDFGDPSQTEIYLWPEGNMAATTSRQTVVNSGNPDGPDFRPYMVRFPAAEGVNVKGAVFICAGGAFQFRSDAMEGTGVARTLSALGYHCFVVNYRLRPYTQQEGALDLARAVRFVRFHADYYGINEDDIAVMGFSAGGILCGEMVLHWKGTVNGSSLDNSYIPDELDNVSADAGAIGHIYSFYGRLSVASTDVDLFKRSNLPPAYFCYGTQDPFVTQFAACLNALRQAEVPVETNILEGAPHGYGYTRGWIPAFDRWLTNVFENNN